MLNGGNSDRNNEWTRPAVTFFNWEVQLHSTHNILRQKYPTWGSIISVRDKGLLTLRSLLGVAWWWWPLWNRSLTAGEAARRCSSGCELPEPQTRQTVRPLMWRPAKNRHRPHLTADTKDKSHLPLISCVPLVAIATSVVMWVIGT